MEVLVLPERLNRMKRVLEKRQKDLILFMDKVKNEHNFSALIRTADAVGILNIYYGWEEDRPVPINKRITMGAHQWVFLKKVENPVEKLKEFKARGFQIVVTWLGEDTLDFREVDYTLPTVIVVGNEVEGVSPELLPIATHRIKIPMVGMVQSLNVSVATGIILYEAFRQREKAGFYNKVHLSEEEISQILYKWGYEDIISSRKK
jgi:tRNA (guanosine-2'-O-)-methyltransferase